MYLHIVYLSFGFVSADDLSHCHSEVLNVAQACEVLAVTYGKTRGQQGRVTGGGPNDCSR